MAQYFIFFEPKRGGASVQERYIVCNGTQSDFKNGNAGRFEAKTMSASRFGTKLHNSDAAERDTMAIKSV